jgi:4-carboxymuconolactone decarboxylase
MPGDDLKETTARTAAELFQGWQGDKPYDLWRAFDPGLAKEMSLFITGRMYGRQRICHRDRQLVAVASLASLGCAEELRLHIHAGLNVGLAPRELAEAVFQCGTYAGVPRVNQALAVLKEVLEDRGQWPPREEG